MGRTTRATMHGRNKLSQEQSRTAFVVVGADRALLACSCHSVPVNLLREKSLHLAMRYAAFCHCHFSFVHAQSHVSKARDYLLYTRQTDRPAMNRNALQVWRSSCAKVGPVFFAIAPRGQRRVFQTLRSLCYKYSGSVHI